MCFSTATYKPTVTITGINGYIASHTGLKFLQDGGFNVRGTVRSRDKLESFRAAYGDHFDNLEIAECDVLDSCALDDAI